MLTPRPVPGEMLLNGELGPLEAVLLQGMWVPLGMLCVLSRS